MIRSVITGFLLGVFFLPAACFAQGTSTGGSTGGSGGTGLGGGSNFEQIDPGQSGINYEFEDIRNEVSFVGPSSGTVVHPYTQMRDNLQANIDSIGGRNGTGATGANQANAAGSRNAGRAQFGGFNSPFEQLIAQQFLGAKC